MVTNLRKEMVTVGRQEILTRGSRQEVLATKVPPRQEVVTAPRQVISKPSIRSWSENNQNVDFARCSTARSTGQQDKPSTRWSTQAMGRLVKKNISNNDMWTTQGVDPRDRTRDRLKGEDSPPRWQTEASAACPRYKQAPKMKIKMLLRRIQLWWILWHGSVQRDQSEQWLWIKCQSLMSPPTASTIGSRGFVSFFFCLTLNFVSL